MVAEVAVVTLAACVALAAGFLLGRTRRGADAARVAAFEAADEAVAVWRGDGLSAWNPAFGKLFGGHALRRGMSAAAVFGAGGSAILDESEAARAVAWVDDRSRTPVAGDAVLRLSARAGRVLEVAARRLPSDGTAITVRDVTDLEAARHRVAAIEARVGDGIEAMDDGFTLWDADDRLTMWNRRFVELFPMLDGMLHPGVTLEACARKVLAHVYRDLQGDAFEQLVRQRMEQHRAIESPRRLARPDGQQLLVLEQRTAEGGRVVIYRDVTAEARAVDELRRSEAQFRDGIESMAEGFVLWGPDRRLRAWNERLLQIMPHLASFMRIGLAHDDFVRQACDAAYPDWTPAAREDWIKDRLAVAWDPEKTVTLALAGDRHVMIVQRRTQDGGLVATYRDVTAEARAAKRIAASEASARRLALAATNVLSGIVILDADSRIVWVNPAMVDMIGLPATEMIGKTPRVAYMSEETPKESMAKIASQLNSGRRVRAEVVLRRVTGAPLWVELDAAPIFGPDGRIDSIVGLHTDIAERKRHEAELERSLATARAINEQHRRFVEIVSHEFRTPLAIIDGAAQRIAARLSELVSDPAIVSRLDRIRAAIARMTGLIDLVLSSARLEEGKLSVEIEPLDLSRLLRDACKRQRQISPQFEIDADEIQADLRMDGDRRLLDQVFANLLSNAIKYSGAARRVEVAARLDGAAGILVSIRDFGVGIDASEIPQLFTRFFRASTAAGIPGTGIGLHFSKELVSLHGGTIELASELGRGTTFSVRLPAPRQSESAAA